MNEQASPGVPATARHPTNPAQLAQAVATSMAEMAGRISGTIAGVMAVPLTAAVHAAAMAPPESQQDEAAPTPADGGEAPVAEARFEASDPLGQGSHADLTADGAEAPATQEGS